MPRNALIQFRRGTAAQWASANPVLASGEVGYVTDTNTLYVGNGVDTFDNLSQIGADISEEAIGQAIADYLAENPIEGAVINDDATSESSVWSSAKTAEEISSVSGTPGAAGADGADGEGVPEGGTSGQWLRKESSTDFDTAWASLPAASTSAQGIVELATTAETVAGSDTARAVTPAGLAAKFIVDPVDESSYPDGTIFLYTGA